MNASASSHLKKSWLINTIIARELLLYEKGDRLPAIQEYADRLSSSRGIVQNAFQSLLESGAVMLEKRGKRGTYLLGKNEARLLEAADLQYITGSLVPPVNFYATGLATGVSLTFAKSPIALNLAFMHSSQNRAMALSRMACDFTMVSANAAAILLKKFPDLKLAMRLEGAEYSPPLCLWSADHGACAISDGDSIAVDKNSNDQFETTMRLCEGKQVRIEYVPYLSTRLAFLHGRVNFVVLRAYEEIPGARCIPIPLELSGDVTTPAILVNSNNYAMDLIVQKYLDNALLVSIQQDVMQGRREPEFY